MKYVLLSAVFSSVLIPSSHPSSLSYLILLLSLLFCFFFILLPHLVLLCYSSSSLHSFFYIPLLFSNTTSFDLLVLDEGCNPIDEVRVGALEEVKIRTVNELKY